MSKRKNLSTNEKFLVGFIIVLILAIAFNWKNFSEKLEKAFESYKQEETQAE